MSKLLEKLQRISEGRAQPLGFEAAITRAKSSQMLLIAGVTAGDAKLSALAAKAGADALLLTVDQRKKDGEVMAQIRSTKADITWGVSLEAVTRKEIEQLAEMKCDFVVFAPDKTPAAVLGEERMGKVLQIDHSLSDNLTKTIARIPIDAVLLSPLSEDKSPLTIHQLMLYEQLAGGVGKHLLAVMPPGLPSEDLESLWSLGVRGVVVDISVERAEQRLSEVKEAIQKLPTKRRKAGGRIGAIVPLAREGAAPTPPEEEDDDDDGDDI
ncbi:MAG: hypothetical protein V3S51_08850 [Dehalococcoidia bacterium]